MGYSKHNGRSSTKIKGRNDKTNDNSEKRENQTSEFERTSGPINNGNVRMDVTNTNNTRDRTSQYDIDGRRKKINERWEELSQPKSSRYSKNVSNSNNRFNIGENKEIQTGWNTSPISSSNGTKETWWQTESRICGVPNGVSFELDKGRNNRIKSLGNSIVPQIVRELGLAILAAEDCVNN